VLTHELLACPSCGATTTRRFELGDGHELLQCTSCEQVYATEYADPGEVYRSGYLRGEVGDFGLDLEHPLFQQYLEAVAARRCALMERVVGAGGRAGSLLDVGCGAGEFLDVARSRGWTVAGLDPVPDAAARARELRGLPVATTTLEGYGSPERRFDVVSALHVLEHVPDVNAFLRALAAWVRPGGHVLIEVPNYASLARRRLLTNWAMLRPLEHLTHFTPDTLQRAFRRAGLAPVHTSTPTYIGPPQDLGSALADLVLDGDAVRRALDLGCTTEARYGVKARLPGPAVWLLLRAVERAYAIRRRGAVVFGIARV
jgi:2-polyprenyl-3-methyl-5-hydroxy-6-metoxy-1,4-benzoquinol methylase